ncbi:MAG: chemotaxis protein CheD [Deltaproteobacteria bacterium]|jgi:chemotaxis protein CheD|nr:chemotaxis protein CheD [Deltaproteobacteria bacterium]
MTTDRAVEVFRYHLTPGNLFSCPDQAMVSAVLGTCVAVCLHDRRLKIGGMNHFQYPKSSFFGIATNDYGDVAIPALIQKLRRMGSRVEDLEAQIFGGGEEIGDRGAHTGLKNVKIARKILKKNGITIVSEDVGGSKGRRLIFHTGTNEALVMKTHRIRRGDYYPYRQRLGSG